MLYGFLLTFGKFRLGFLCNYLIKINLQDFCIVLVRKNADPLHIP